MLAGAPDAGSEAFAYTSLASLMLANHDPRLYHGNADGVREAIPERVGCVSLTHDCDHIYSELYAVLDTSQFDALTESDPFCAHSTAVGGISKGAGGCGKPGDASTGANEVREAHSEPRDRSIRGLSEAFVTTHIFIPVDQAPVLN